MYLLSPTSVWSAKSLTVIVKDAQLTIAMSLYNDNGYEIPMMNRTMTALLSVNNQRKCMLCNEGNR